jgi:S1-C subfamily serine protease
LRSGDVITAVNGESLSADNGKTANRRLLDFMEGVEPGDVLTIEYLRGGKVGSVEVEPRIVDKNVFVWKGDGGPHALAPVPEIHAVPDVMREFRFDFPWVGSGLGELELVELNAGLGRYFGTDTGLLVVSAPESDAFELQDGDVIQSIDGREPKDVRHAMRILGSYQAGETLKLGIVRDKKKRTLDVEIPAKQSGMIFEVLPEVSPASILIAPEAPPAMVITERT